MIFRMLRPPSCFHKPISWIFLQDTPTNCCMWEALLENGQNHKIKMVAVVSKLAMKMIYKQLIMATSNHHKQSAFLSHSVGYSVLEHALYFEIKYSNM